MRRITISDNTVRHSGLVSGTQLSFRLKIEIAKLLDDLGVDAIETAPIADDKTDYLLVKSISTAIRNAAVKVPVDILAPDSPALSWAALHDAVHPVLQVPAPVSTVQMEYFCHSKPAGMISRIKERVSACTGLCDDVEFVALDFTRADEDFLAQAIAAAVEAGAGTVTVSDMAGNLLPDEFGEAVARVRAIIPENVRLGVQCSNALQLADACAVAAIKAGACEVKTSVFGRSSASVSRFSHILDAKSDVLDAKCDINLTALEHVTAKVREMCEAYQVNPRISTGALESLDAREVEAELPVVPTYILDSYLITSSNITRSSCLLKIKTADGRILESICAGNGPVDASFLAMEKVVGTRYELDDFKIRSVTEGREAMGETVVLLRHEGKLYSGKGVSTDIVGSSILAYLDAVNKIVYEEDKA